VSQVSAPLLDNGNVLGIINVESVRTRLDENDLRAIAAVADRLSAYLALAQERQRLAELTIRDPLTGLHNRRFLADSVVRLFAARARRTPDERQPVSIALFDLDKFGELNKKHGHALGDEVLRSVAQQLANRFRASDLLARYGGEEFVVLLDGANLDEAAQRAEEVRAELAATTIEFGGTSVGMTISAGCASLSRDDDRSWDELLAAADVALQMAKRGGRNQVVAAA
jgi:diguanylate cyclase (GGDEF)-like protein